METCSICGDEFKRLGSHIGSKKCLENATNNVGNFVLIEADKIRGNIVCDICGEEVEEGRDVLVRIQSVRSGYGSMKRVSTKICFDCTDESVLAKALKG